jgi:hypothetical protein
MLLEKERRELEMARSSSASNSVASKGFTKFGAPHSLSDSKGNKGDKGDREDITASGLLLQLKDTPPSNVPPHLAPQNESSSRELHNSKDDLAFERADINESVILTQVREDKEAEDILNWMRDLDFDEMEADSTKELLDDEEENSDNEDPVLASQREHQDIL